MILNQTNINNAIIQASCCMATKATKYYNGLALGKDNMCLFKEVVLLQKYIDILQCFEIVGSTTTCECSIVGEYNLNGILYQFLSDGTGSYIDISEFHTFTWSENNGQLFILLEGEPNYPQIISPLPILDPINDYFLAYVNSNPIYNSLGPFTTIEELINDFNDNNTGGFTLSEVNGELVFQGPLNSINDEFIFVQIDTVIVQGLIEGGPLIIDYTFNNNCDIILDNFNLPWLYSAILTITNDDYPELPITINIYNDLSILQDSIEIPPGSTSQQIVDLFNLYNESISSGLSMEFTAPNIYTVTSSSLFLSYENWSVEWLQYESLAPEPVAYTANFEGVEELTLINENPCTPTVIEQTCLTNKQVTNIIKNINKICKIC